MLKKIINIYILICLSLIFLIFSSCGTHSNDWQQININLNDNFHDIAQVNKDILVAYSYGTGKIIKSEDQGMTWRIVHKTDSIYYEQIQFTTESTGYICGNTNQILKTEDGGSNWTAITIDAISDSAPIYGMKFTNNQTGYLSVLQRTSTGFESIIYKTSDSGLNWNQINSIPEMILNLELVNNEVWASGNNVVLRNINSNSWGTVYKDTMKEVGQIRDFVVHEDNIVMASFNGYIINKRKKSIEKRQITTNRIRSIVSIGERKIIAAGDNNNEKGNLFKSLDGGKTWHLIEKDFSDIHRLKVKNELLWGIGKNDELIKMEL